jgi:hypothetical protein
MPAWDFRKTARRRPTRRAGDRCLHQKGTRAPRARPSRGRRGLRRQGWPTRSWGRGSASAHRPAVPPTASQGSSRLRGQAHCCSRRMSANHSNRAPSEIEPRRSRLAAEGRQDMAVMTADVDANELRDAVERLHGCPAQLVEAVPLSESFEGLPGWHGVVHVFDLGGHRSADRCYAWSSQVEGDQRRLFAVLHTPPVASPADAVRAAIARELAPGRDRDQISTQHRAARPPTEPQM